MDLHIVGAEPTPVERAAVDALLGPPDSGWEGGPRAMERDGRVARGGRPAALARRDLLLPAFHAVQDRHYVTDLHATILHQLGLDHQRLEIPGRKRLEIDFGHPIKEIVA